MQDGHVHVQCDPCFISQLLVLAEPELSGIQGEYLFFCSWLHNIVILPPWESVFWIRVRSGFLWPVISVTGIICGSALVSVRIRIQHFRSVRIWIQIQGVDDQKLVIFYSWKSGIFLYIEYCKIFIPRPPWRMSIDIVQATGVAPSLQKITSSTAKQYISLLFPIYLLILANWIRIQRIKIVADPDSDPADQIHYTILPLCQIRC